MEILPESFSRFIPVKPEPDYKYSKDTAGECIFVIYFSNREVDITIFIIHHGEQWECNKTVTPKFRTWKAEKDCLKPFYT